ncbi:ARM repeat-containing protein [Hesseltinella vesiculosa]|uniref:eIF-2-alpha kinase activator GCN1 n=1 Tax=Hesseltinella vesiculosa TaxID=101127 RepID=A0A1X2G599_9FUNG|nr:ARM repeat-containing protein [Hesseltinella vesiculosa]
MTQSDHGDLSWVEYIKFDVVSNITTSKVSDRLDFLNNSLLRRVKRRDMPDHVLPIVLNLLKLTYTRYQDRPSRQAVLDIFTEFNNWQSTAFQKLFVPIVTREAEKCCKQAPGKDNYLTTGADRFILLTWINLLICFMLGNNDKDIEEVLPGAVGAQAILLLSLAEGSKNSIWKSGLSSVRRTIRCQAPSIPNLLDIILKAPPTTTNASSILVGTLVDVCLHLKDVDGKSRYLEERSAELMDYYLKHIASSKVRVQPSILYAFDGYVHNFIDENCFESQVAPVLEKMMLRSPEVVLSTLSHIISSLSFDPSLVFTKNLSEPLSKQFCSTSPAIRTAALALCQDLGKVCHDTSSLLTMTGHLTKLLQQNKLSSAEHRTDVYQSLSALSAGNSPQVCCKALLDGYIPMVSSRETNESALVLAIQCTEKPIQAVLRKCYDFDVSTLEKVTQTIASGLASAKPMIRTQWANIVGSVYWNDTQDPIPMLMEQAYQYIDPLFASVCKLTTKPSAWKDSPLEVYVLVSFLKGQIESTWPSIPEKVQDILSKYKYPLSMTGDLEKEIISFLTLDRVFTKALTKEEGVWLTRALFSVMKQGDADLLKSGGIGHLLGQPLIWTIVHHPSKEVRRLAYESLASLSISAPEKVSKALASSFTVWLLDIEQNNKTSVPVQAIANSPNGLDIRTSQRFASVLRAICDFRKLPEHIKSPVLVEMVVLAHHRYLAPSERFNWIVLVQKAGVDPGTLVRNFAPRIKALIQDALHHGNDASSMFYEAGLSAISTLSFIDPSVAPMYFDNVTALAPAIMSGITEFECDVWRTCPDVAFVDVLKKNETNYGRERKSKDQDWEDQIRAELAAKKNEARKLTKEETAAVNAQLKKEAAIRNHVQHVYTTILLGLDVLDSLIPGSVVGWDDATSQLLLQAVSILLALANANAGMLVKDKILKIHLHLTKYLQREMEPSLSDALTLATLRTSNLKYIPSEWCDEPLSSLVARVIYRLRYQSESKPLSPYGFAISFPLLDQVIRQNGIVAGDSKESTALEQVNLALDIIGFHASLGSQEILPRQAVLDTLLHVISEYPGLAKPAKSYLLSFCEAMEDTNVTSEEYAVLFHGLLSDESAVRFAALNALEMLDLSEMQFSIELWIACHDEESEANALLAVALWDNNELSLRQDQWCSDFLDFVTCNNGFVRTASSGALADCISLYPELASRVLDSIYHMYREKAAPLDPEYDQLGLVIPETLNREDPWWSRSGLAIALKKCAPHIQVDNALKVLHFLIHDLALGDRNETVRKQMLEAGLAMVNAYGKEHPQLLEVFEKYLDLPPISLDRDTLDYIRQSVVILYGASAGYLAVGDPKIRVAVDKLIDTLDTPSEVVQSSVADCLPPLIKMIKDETPNIVESLFKKLFESEKYAVRKGAAYGLAGVVKGRGIAALKECNVIQTLKDAVDNKRNYQYRQGALFAFETLSGTLGRLFEPYVSQIIPLLLVCFSDTNVDVREASADTGRMIMSKISGHCVKLILPSILEGLDERQWRTKKASVELLGAMAYCAPKQLSVSLPNIIPRITEVLADTHSQVQAAGKRSLQMFGEVISNPEIQLLVPDLLQALSDPNKKTMIALKKLLQTSFVHYIDSPSLAIVMPILERGLRERGTEIKTKSAQIVGNMATLTDQKDLVPYLPVVLPCVKEVLMDPVPEARGTAAKALGSLVEKLGEDNFPNLVIELLDTLKADSGGVDRQGAAQGLAEVLAGLGLDRLESLLPDIIANADSPRPYVREGFISLLIYLPATYGPRFQPYIGRVIPPILMGLADESEFVRDASLRAGRMIVKNYATKAVDLLLPELEKGVFDHNWRIRQSSVQLVSDLLFRITGTSDPSKSLQALGNASNLDEEDADEGAQDEHQGDKRKHQLRDVLGKERSDRILSALYIVRRDSSGLVRQASLQVWKAIVSNTPRTVRDILPTMMSMIIQLLSCTDEADFDKRNVAARTVSDLVAKLGERVLPDILPILQSSLQSQDDSVRQGVMVAFGEVIATADRVQVTDFIDQIVPTLRQSLCDSSDEVRGAAAQTFDTLHQSVGSRAIDDILPFLLNQLQAKTDTSTYALSALKEIMTVRSNVVFPVLIPTLIAVPITAFNAGALASLVTVAGPALNRRLSSILDALVTSCVLAKGDVESEAQLIKSIEALVVSIDDEDGLSIFISTLFQEAKSDQPQRRAVACNIIASFFKESEVDASDYVGDWISTLILLLNDHEMEVVQSAWSALSAVVKSVDKDEYEIYVALARRAVEIMSAPGTDVKGFCMIPKGLGAILPIFLQSLMYGAIEAREQGALAIGDLIERTSEAALKPFVTQITGPLIRIVGDRYPGKVKTSILKTLSQLLNKVPMHVKPFLPQLQRSFIKSLQEPDDEIRENAATALGVLIPLLLRVDPLVAELVSGVRTSENDNIKLSMIRALSDVVEKVGDKMNGVSRNSVESVVTDGEGSEDSTIQLATQFLKSALLLA